MSRATTAGTPYGYVAMDFFFVLSGFIMSYTYLADFRARGMRAYGPFLAKRAARIVQARPFYFLGVVSFSLYLLHSPFRDVELLAFQSLFPEKVGAATALAFAFIGACSTIPVAWLAYVTVERPGRKLLHLMLVSKQDRAPVTLAQV